MSCARPAARRAESGFTLIETMVAGVLLSVLVLGFMGLMVSSAQVSNESVVRQKAIFVLNGEMERLSAMYGLTSFGAFGPLSSLGYPALPGAVGLPGVRYVYRDSVASYADDFVTDDVATFKSGAESLVYHHDPGALLPKRNYVWLDRDRGVAGRLSWSYAALPSLLCALPNCGCLNYNGGTLLGSCGRVDLVIEYPYRLDGDDVMLQQGELQTLTLKTIVGRRE